MMHGVNEADCGDHFRTCVYFNRSTLHLKDLQSPLINHPPVKLINHTAIQMRGHKMKRKAVNLQGNLIKNDNGKKRRKNKTDKDPNLREFIFYLDKTETKLAKLR